MTQTAEPVCWLCLRRNLMAGHCCGGCLRRLPTALQTAYWNLIRDPANLTQRKLTKWRALSIHAMKKSYHL